MSSIDKSNICYIIVTLIWNSFIITYVENMCHNSLFKGIIYISIETCLLFKVWNILFLKLIMKFNHMTFCMLHLLHSSVTLIAFVPHEYLWPFVCVSMCVYGNNSCCYTPNHFLTLCITLSPSFTFSQNSSWLCSKSEANASELKQSLDMFFFNFFCILLFSTLHLLFLLFFLTLF